MVAVRIGTQRPNKFSPTDCVGPNCSANPLPAGYVAHVGQAVGDALVAIDAGRIAASQRGGVETCRPRTLAGEVHGVVVVAVTAFQRVVGFQSRPLVFGQLTTHAEELLTCVDGAEDLAPDLLRGLHLAGDLVGPFMGNVTVRAGGAHAGAVAVVDGFLDLHVHVVFHFIACNAEGLGVGGYQRGVETAPEDDASKETAQDKNAQAVMHAGAAQYTPVAFEKGQYRFHRLPSLSGDVSR